MFDHQPIKAILGALHYMKQPAHMDVKLTMCIGLGLMQETGKLQLASQASVTLSYLIVGGLVWFCASQSVTVFEGSCHDYCLGSLVQKTDEVVFPCVCTFICQWHINDAITNIKNYLCWDMGFLVFLLVWDLAHAHANNCIQFLSYKEMKRCFCKQYHTHFYS